MACGEGEGEEAGACRLLWAPARAEITPEQPDETWGSLHSEEFRRIVKQLGWVLVASCSFFRNAGACSIQRWTAGDSDEAGFHEAGGLCAGGGVTL